MRYLARPLSALLLATVLFTGCSRDDMVNETMDQVTKLTDEVVEKVKSAEDKKAAIAEAKAMIEAKQGDLQPKMQEISGLRGFQVNEETVQKFTSSLFDATMKMSTLQLDLMLDTAQDPELETQLAELIAAHDALIDIE